MFVILANSKSTFTNRFQQVIEGYLGYKYGVQSLLPTSHPYYSATNSKVVNLIY